MPELHFLAQKTWRQLESGSDMRKRQYFWSIKIIDENKPFQCSTCGSVFSQKSTLKIHIEAVSKEPIFLSLMISFCHCIFVVHYFSPMKREKRKR